MQIRNFFSSSLFCVSSDRQLSHHPKIGLTYFVYGDNRTFFIVGTELLLILIILAWCFPSYQYIPVNRIPRLLPIQEIIPGALVGLCCNPVISPPPFVPPKVNLAQELESLGVDVIQTEGKFSLDPSK